MCEKVLTWEEIDLMCLAQGCLICFGERLLKVSGMQTFVYKKTHLDSFQLSV